MELTKFNKVKYTFSIIVLIQYILAMFLWSVGIYAFLPFLVFLCIYVTKMDVAEKMYINLFLIVSMFTYFITTKEFNFLPQAKALLDINSNLLYWVVQGHVHAVRLFIAFPGYLLSKWLDIGLNEGFGYYCIIIFILFYRNIIEIIKMYIYNMRNICLYYTISFLIILGLFYLMNGRIIFAFYGLSLILLANVQLYIGVEFSLKHILMMAIGILFTMVSSGTLVVGTATAVFGIAFSNQLRKILKKKWVWIIGILCLPVMYVFFKYLIAMINKNIDFFGGGFHGIISMLHHGLGGYLYVDNLYGLIGFVVLGFLIIVLNALIVVGWYKRKVKILPILLSFNISIYGSLFGIATGTTSIIGLMFIVYYIIEKIRIKEISLNKDCIDV